MVLFTAGLYAGILIADRTNELVLQLLNFATRVTDEDERRFDEHSRFFEHAVPRRWMAFKWTAILGSLSYLMTIYIGLSFVLASAVTLGAGTLAELDPAAMTWVRHVAAWSILLLVVAPMTSAALFLRVSYRLFVSIHIATQHMDDAPPDNRGITGIGLEIGRLIPRSLMHA